MKFAFGVVLLSLIAAFGASAASFQVDKTKSSLQAKVRASPPHSFDAVVTNYDAAIAIGPDGKVASAKISFLFENVDTDSGGRDKKMRKWMNIAANPKVSFVLSEVVERDGTTIGLGELTMHGVSKTLEIPFTMSVVSGKAVLDGSAMIDTRIWNLEIISLLFFTVKPELEINFHLEGAIIE